MYVMLFPRHLQSATKLVETICHRGPLLRFASLKKVKLNFPHPLQLCRATVQREENSPTLNEGDGGRGHRCGLFCSLKLPHLGAMHFFLL